MMWVDDPMDRLLPSDEALQALRAFANQAMGAIESARQLESLRAPRRARPAHRPAQPPRLRAAIDAAIADAGAAGDSSLLVLDLDHFKRVNDSLGHDAGDDVLRRFADACCATLPARPTSPTRLGGEEFALVLPGRGEATRAGRRRAPAPRGRRASSTTSPCPVSVSVGVAGSGRRGARRAPSCCAPPTARCFAAKRLGRDRCVVHHAQTLEMLDALRDAEGGRAASSSRPRCCWPRRSTCATSPPPATPRPSAATPSRSPRELGFAADAGRARARRRHPPRHRQARHRRRDPAQARRARRPRVGRDQAPPRARRPHPRARQPARHRGLGAAPPRARRRPRLPARAGRRARSRSRRASSPSRTPTRR